MARDTKQSTTQHSRCRSAYLECLPEARALAREHLREVDLDVEDAASLVLHTLPKIRATRPLLAQLPGVNLRAIDRVEKYALAALFTHYRFLARGQDDAQRVSLRANQKYEELCRAVEALPESGRTPPCVPQTPRDLAHDILLRTQAARTFLNEVLPYEERFVSTLEVVIAAELTAEELLAHLAVSEPELTQEQLSDERVRTFTLLVEAYEHGVRPAIDQLMRRRDDLEALAAAAAFQAVVDELGPDAVQLMNPDDSPFGVN